MENDLKNDLAAECRIRIIRAMRDSIALSPRPLQKETVKAIIEKADNFFDVVLLTIYPEDGHSLRGWR